MAAPKFERMRAGSVIRRLQRGPDDAGRLLEFTFLVSIRAGFVTHIYSIDGITPVVHRTAYVHPSAVLIGDVIVGAGVYIGPLASLRGDFGRIVVRKGANVQDCCILHGFPDMDTLIEEDGHIGHGAVIHGARIRRNAMVGMNAVVNDYAVVGESAIIAALAFV
jgi:phenylacetic acid degradation protein